MMICQGIVGSLNYLARIVPLMALQSSPMMAGQVDIRHYSGRRRQHHLHCQNSTVYASLDSSCLQVDRFHIVLAVHGRNVAHHLRERTWLRPDKSAQELKSRSFESTYV